MYPDLKGKCAIVTGCASPGGIGRAIVEALAVQGVNVCCSDIAAPQPDFLMEAMGYTYGAEQGLSATVDAAKSHGVHALAVTADVTDAEQVEAMVKQAHAQLGRIDILVNVAGGSWGSNRVAEYEPQEWLKTLHINLYGTFLTIKFALGYMENQGSGAIVNIASIAAERSHDMVSAYGAAKAGVVQFTRDVATEYGPSGIRANALLPGDINTDMLKMEFRGMGMLLEMGEDEVAALSAQSTPLRRLGEAKDVANTAVFLCSDAASFLTGLAIPVTGGKQLPFRAH